MPEFAYGGTITFDPNTLLEDKEKLIQQLPNRLSQHLSHKTNRYYLCVSREYHKVDGEDDLEAPHLHFIVYSDGKIPKYRVSAINEMLKIVYGRSNFYMMTTLKTKSYSKYILKDCERLLELTGKSHYYETNLEEFIDEYDFIETVFDLDEDL